MGIEALGAVDRNSLAGIVRAHEAARATSIRLVVGCRLDLADSMSVLVYPTDRPAYGEHGWFVYNSFAFPFAERAFPRCNIERHWSLDALVGYIGTWSAVGRAKAAGEIEMIDRAMQDLRRLWGSGKVRKRVECPINGRLGWVPDITICWLAAR